MSDREKLLEQTGRMIDHIVKGLEGLDEETKLGIMERCGEACAEVGDLTVAKKIAAETDDIDEIVARANGEILWCGKWAREGNVISAVCNYCGCPLVRQGVVELTGTFCYCSRGWVRAIFETLLKKPVKVELEKAIGLGDDICKYNVYF
ncbi:MAG: DUF6144 family protein [Candidatus Bathyarchaeota archaeon]|nr:DUF6144 family protein [Candidatus Bathyarchaeota archaeon]